MDLSKALKSLFQKERGKIMLAALFPLVLFGIHGICTVLYNIPENPLSKTYLKSVSGYMEPLFAQDWHLFAPEPATRMVKLWYRVKVDDAWQRWQDPMEPVLEKHRHNRATSHAKLLYIYGNIAKNLIIRQSYIVENITVTVDSRLEKSRQNDSLKASPEYRLALRFVTRDIKTGYDGISNPDSLQLMLALIYPKQFSERLTNRPFSYAEMVEMEPDIYDPIPNE